MSEPDTAPSGDESTAYIATDDAITSTVSEGAEHNDELDADGVPPYEDRLGPDGAEGENPVLPQPSPIGPKSDDGDDQFDEDQDEQYDTVSSPGTLVDRGVGGSQVLPWGAPKERARFPSSVHIETDIKPGEFVMRTLFAEFTIQAEKKITAVMSEPLERPLSKSLQRGEDPHFDQILSAFGSVAEHCLPSILKTLIAWYEKQGVEWIVSDYKPSKSDSKGKFELSLVTEMEFVSERRDLAVEFIFCLVLIEVLKQLHVHPGHEDLVHYIENLCFKHFKYRGAGETLGPNATSIHTIADLYAEVLGVLASSRFQSVKKRFTGELRELRSKEPSDQTTKCIVSLLMGMKFFRVKMVPIEEFEDSFQFIQECGAYFLEVRDKDIKHAMAGLFVEILVPVAASVKNEVNVPCLKNLVEMLYSQTLDMCTKNKHRLALFPLVTCLLCVSQKPFFLHNWHYFLTMCLQHLKNRDPKMSRVALESLFRLLWVYMIRIKCESNNVTQSRLQSIVKSLFPTGSKTVVPRDTPLNIFVKIIQFISQEKLDFAMREIIFDLLSVGRPIKMINAPERMSIGLRAFLVVADSLQQKEGEPPMPRTVGVMPSGSTLRVKKTFLNKMLTEDAAKNIGISSYYPYVRKVFDDILRALDTQFGKPFMMTNSAGVKDVNAEEAKPKLDLFRTVIAAIPRLIPDGMSRSDLVETLSRLTVHTDEELRVLSCQALQNLVIDFPDWREDVLWGFLWFTVKEVTDQHPTLLDNSLRMINQLLAAWRNAMEKLVPQVNRVSSQDPTRPDPDKPDILKVLHNAEGFALTMLCHVRVAPRRLVVHTLKEVKLLFQLTGVHRTSEDLIVLDAMDKVTRSVVEQNYSVIPAADRLAINSSNRLDLQWLADRSSTQWSAGFHDDGTARSGSNQNLFSPDPWSACYLAYFEHNRLPASCPSAILHAWPIVHTRLTQLFTTVDPAPLADNRSSLLRPGTAPKKPANERDISMHLWKNYIAMACRVVPSIPAATAVIRCVSPDLSLPHLSSSPESLSALERQDNKSPGPMLSPPVMYKLLVPLLRCEVSDVRDSVVQACGHINHIALMDFLSEKIMLDYIKEAIDRRTESRTRRRRRDALRLQLVKVFEIVAKQGTFSRAFGVIDDNTDSLAPIFIDYIDGVRQFLELESDKDVPIFKEIKIHFLGFIRQLVGSFPLDKRRTLIRKELRRHLFNLFAGWSGRFGQLFGMNTRPANNDNTCTEFEFSALQSMLAVLCSGPYFDHSMFAEDGEVYRLLDLLLASEDSNIYGEGQRAVVMLLEVNPDLSPLLDWVVDRCYTGTNRQADGCFIALATIFSTREYNCDHYTAIINVTLMNCGCPRIVIHETALQLLQILDNRFFGTILPLGTDEDVSSGKERSTLDVLLSTTYSRSQLYLSRQLAQLHPELTMPMFSEICSRLQTARPVARQNLLQYLLPWLYNIELVDSSIPPHTANYQYPYYQSYEMGRPGVRREGWGSAEATEMVTNNLFYITCRFGDDHPKEVEELWAALCACWPNNLRVIVRYLMIVSGMAPNEVLDYSKRVILYLGRSQPVRTLDEIMLELQTVETFNVIIERTETPPYYRLTNLRKGSSNLENNNVGRELETIGIVPGSKTDLTIEKGVIHTKRHSQEEPGKEKTELSLAGSLRSAGSMATSAGSAIIQKVAEKARALSGSQMTSSQLSHHNQMTSSQMSSSVMTSSQISTSNTISMSTNAGGLSQSKPVDHHLPTSDDHISNVRSGLLDQPSVISGDGSNGESVDISADTNDAGLHPLPMPEFGGWFAPLTEFLPDPAVPIPNFHRCNLAVILLSDLVVDGLDLDCHSVDWSVHMPLMLHIIFLGMDNSRPIVHEHCKQLLLNLLVVLGCHSDHLSVAGVLLNNKTNHLDYGLLPQTERNVLHHNFLEEDEKFDSYLTARNRTEDEDSEDEEEVNSVTSEPSMSSARSSTRSRVSGVTFAPPTPDMSIADVMKALIQFIASKKNDGVLWQYEDTTKNLSIIKSSEQMGIFLQHVLKVFEESLPHAHLAERWAQLGIQLALSCSSRHYAGRSLQIFRALRVPISSRILSDILSRLVETISEQGDDIQGYVTELILTLEAVVDTLDSDFRPMEIIREIFKSTPNLKEVGGIRRGVVGYGAPSPLQHNYHVSAPPIGPYHARTTSYNMSPHHCRKTNISPGPAEPRGRSSTESDAKVKSQTNLARSRSAQSLKIQDQASQEDKMNILVQLFWICVAILESDYEHEFLLGLRLLDKVLSKLPLDRPDTREKVEKILTGLKWPQFPGLHSLLLKGCTHPNTYEPTIALLSRLTLQLDFPVVDPSQSLAFPMNVIALLPYLVMNYEDGNDLCITSADNIARVSTEKSKKLENLSTVMTLYSRRTFCKESFQWTKCVVKYLYDTYSHLSLSMLGFLVEVLEKGPPAVQPSILTIIHCMAHYVDLQSATNSINSDLLRAVSKFVESVHWKEAMKILKLAVTRSSTLVAPPSTSHITNPHHWEPHTSFAEAEVYFKKELPGRTMEFTFDLSQTPVIERRHRRTGLSGIAPYGHEKEDLMSATSPRRSLSLSTADSSSFSGWKRPWMSQGRVRECLVNLLNTCGQKVGLPKSPSVIFSQSSELLERQSSMASSTECVSGPGNDVSTEQSKHDTTDTEQRFGMYMKDFDFLEYELESLEGESVDNFNWGVRRPSLSNMEGELIGGVEQRLPQHKPEGAEESSDEELESVSPVDELSARSAEEHSGASSSVSTTSSGVYPPSSLPLEGGRARRSSTPHSETESGECSEGEMSDLTPCNASPSLSQLLSWSGCRRIERDDVEENWRQHVQTLMTSSSQDNLLHTFSLFARLFRDLRTKTVGLTEDSCVFLSRDESMFSGQLKGAVGQFKTLLGVLSGVPDCPHVWCDFNLLGDPRLTERIKFNVLEIQENFENYVDKKDTTMSCLEGLKAHAKLLSLGESLDSCTSMESDQVELCRFLYKLHFQQLLLLESYTKLLQLLSGAASSSGVTDLSEKVAGVRSDLLTALADTLTPPGSPAHNAPGSPNRASTPSYRDSVYNQQDPSKSDSPTPRGTPPSEQEECVRPVTPDGEGGPTPTASCSESEELATESLFIPPNPSVVLPEISLTPPPRSTSPPVEEIDHSQPEHEEVFITEMSPDPAPLPETQSEAMSLILSHLNSGRWKDVWKVWRGCRQLWDSVYTLGCVPGSISWSQAHQDTEDLTQILNIYCRHLADGREGIFVMTVSSVDLGSVCASLMDISLQLLASVKSLERSLSQKNQPDSPTRIESSL